MLAVAQMSTVGWRRRGIGAWRCCWYLGRRCWYTRRQIVVALAFGRLGRLAAVHVIVVVIHRWRIFAAGARLTRCRRRRRISFTAGA